MLMRNIIITDGINTITSLNDLVFDIQPIEILSSVTMASGREVRDVIGYKDNLKLPLGYLTLDQVNLLRNMIKNNNGLLQISYPTPNGDVTDWFIVNQPTYTSFGYNDEGVAIWKGVTINCTQVEVQR